MTAPKRGDRVRVVLEGVVTSDALTDGFFVGGAAGGRTNYIGPECEHVVSVEVLPPPEPEWQPGDVVRDAHGVVYRRAHSGRWHNFDGSSLDDLAAYRPLTRLVPEGQS